MRHVTPWFEAQAVPEEDHFSAIMEMFWQEARLAVTDAGPTMPEGEFEFEQGASRVEGLVLRERGVSTLRIVRCGQEKTPRVFVSELFLARPASRPPVVGIRAWRLDMAGEPVSGSQKRPSLWDRLSSSGYLVGPREGAPLPFFRDVRDALLQPEPLAKPVDALVDNEAFRQVELDRDYYLELAESRGEQLRAVEIKLAHLKESFRSVATEEQLAEEQRAERTLKELPVWALENESRIVLLPRALAGARRSQYQSDDDIYRALEFLAGPYRDQRINVIDTEAFQTALQSLQTDGFQLARSVDPSVAGEQGEAYFVRYGARRRFLDWHLIKGGGRDERYCLRIYFFWDDAQRVAVIGSLPAHLANSLS